MAKPDKDLDAARRQIDAIDDALHDLIMQRAEAVAAVRAAKGEGAPVFRPAREAQVMRRLLAHHSGSLPRASLVQIWRELTGAALIQQDDVSVDVADPRCRALARDHFGAAVPTRLYDSTDHALNAAAAHPANIAVLPLPSPDGAHRWWPRLVTGSGRKRAPAVIGRLPFLSTDGDQALMVARIASEDSGDDETLVVLEGDAAIDDRAAVRACAAEGFTHCAVVDRAPVSGKWLTLVQLHGFIAPNDERIGKLAEGAAPVRAAHWIGSYPVPLSATTE